MHASATVYDKFASGTGRLFSEPRAAEDGVAAREVRDARDIGPHNATDIASWQSQVTAFILIGANTAEIGSIGLNSHDRHCSIFGA